VTDFSHDSPDDGFHEIQLSGKQLVFLFMATTVVSVVIFLCGVLVGRGVRAEALKAADRTAPVSSGGPSVASTATTIAPPPPVMEPPAGVATSINRRLESDKAVPEVIRERPAVQDEPVLDARSTPAAAVAKPETSPAKTAPPAPPPVAPAASEPQPGMPQPGVWAVQVVALTDPAAATAVVTRLKGKGYPAFLVSPPSGAAVRNYKVQVGRFEERSEAELVAGRLKKEEQFQPWILR
jgi:cell division septation protein DedD